MPEVPVIVFVDDEENVLRSLKRLFFDSEYDIHTFQSAEEALEKLPALDADIVVSDQMMPGMKGVEFLEKAFEVSPISNFLLLTAYPEYNLVTDALNKANICQFLTKPWNPGDFAKLVNQIMDDRRKGLMLTDEVQGIRLSNEEQKKRVETMKQQVKQRVQVILSKNKELFQSNKALESNLWDTIRIFFSMLESKSQEVGQHCMRVSKLAMLFAHKMAISQDEMTTLEIASLLHDIGKIALPEYLLERTGHKYSKEEEDLLTMHPLIGQYSFSTIPLLKEIGLIIRHHHERWNGKGFPDGIQGTEISMLTRMLSICNKYDNLFYLEFKYHPTKKQKILNRMMSEAGISLDPNLTKLFISDVTEVNEIDELEKGEDKEQSFDPTKLLNATLEKLYEKHERLRNGSIKVTKEYGNVPSIVCFPLKLKEMLQQLIENAIEAIPARGNIIIYMGVLDDYLKVAVSDDGLGIERKNMEKIFMPGYTTKDTRLHEGMGLTIFYDGLKAHSAKLELSSDPGKGSTFTFHIPLEL